MFGSKRVDAVTSADVLAAVLPIWTAKRETASRVRQRISAVMKWSVAQGYRVDDPAGEAVLQALPKGVGTARRHHRALPYAEVVDAVRTVRASGAWIGAKLAFEWLVFTACRSGEVRGARWDEIDGDVWTVPAERTDAPHAVMEAALAHVVPNAAERAYALQRPVRAPTTAGAAIGGIPGP